jgi:hypothetical protein
MSYFLCDVGDNPTTPFQATFTFNSEIGSSIGKFKYRIANSNIPSTDA